MELRFGTQNWLFFFFSFVQLFDFLSQSSGSLMSVQMLTGGESVKITYAIHKIAQTMRILLFFFFLFGQVPSQCVWIINWSTPNLLNIMVNCCLFDDELFPLECFQQSENPAMNIKIYELRKKQNERKENIFRLIDCVSLTITVCNPKNKN